MIEYTSHDAEQHPRPSNIISDNAYTPYGRLSTPAEKYYLLLRVHVTPTLQKLADAADMKVYDYLEAYINLLSEAHQGAPESVSAPFDSTSTLSISPPPPAKHDAVAMSYPAYPGKRFGRLLAGVVLLSLVGWMARASNPLGKAIEARRNVVNASQVPDPKFGNLELTTSVVSTSLKGQVYNGNLKPVDKNVCFHVILHDATGKLIADRHIHEPVFWPACHVSSFEIQTGLPLAAPNQVSLTVEPAEQ